MASWSVTGLFLTLTPSVVTDVLHVTQGAAGGLDIAALFLAGGMGGMCSAHHTVRQATLLGAVLLTVGSARPCGGHGPAVPGRDWPATTSDRAGRDRTPTVPGHEVSGVVTELGYGTTGLTVIQRVFGLTDWTRDGSLTEYVAVEARNLAPLPADVDHTVAASLPICGLTAWQGLFDHAHLTTGQTMMIHGASPSSSPARREPASSARAAPPTGTPSSAWARTRASTCRPTGGRTQARSTWCST